MTKEKLQGLRQPLLAIKDCLVEAGKQPFVDSLDEILDEVFPLARQGLELREAVLKLRTLPNWENRLGDWRDVNEAIRNIYAK